IKLTRVRCPSERERRVCLRLPPVRRHEEIDADPAAKSRPSIVPAGQQLCIPGESCGSGPSDGIPLMGERTERWSQKALTNLNLGDCADLRAVSADSAARSDPLRS